MKRLLLLAFAVMAMLGARAEEDANAVFVHPKEGVPVAYLFEAKPVVTYTESEIVIKGTGIDVVYAIADVEKMDFDVVQPTSVDDVKASNVKVMCNGDQVTVSGIEAQSPVFVYNLAGQMVAKAVADAGGSASVEVPAAGPNFYIIKTNSVSFKIAKK